MNPRIIGITGAKGSGKSTVAAILERLIVLKFPGTCPRIVSFADPVRAIVNVAFGVTAREMSDPILKEKPLQRYPNRSPRHLMQQVRTEMFRSAYPDVWTREVTADAGIGFNPPWIITPDVRFPDEAEALLKSNGTLIRIIRPDLENSDSHSSEAHWKTLPVCLDIINKGSLVHLQSEVEHAFFALINT